MAHQAHRLARRHTGLAQQRAVGVTQGVQIDSTSSAIGVLDACSIQPSAMLFDPRHTTENASLVGGITASLSELFGYVGSQRKHVTSTRFRRLSSQLNKRCDGG